jgi:type II secretory pathway pseudopilin PulG
MRGMALHIRRRHTTRSAFTLLDVMVAISVIAILLALLTPTLSAVTENARRIVCASNMRQVGLGISMWANSNNGMVPTVSLAQDRTIDQTPDLLQLAYLDKTDADWDGLGLLVSEGYITAPSLFYCPSHNGNNTFARYEESWVQPEEEIITNYHYRWLAGSNRFLDNLNADVTLLTDGLRTKVDYNHRVGNNMLKADLRVEWLNDPDMVIVKLLPDRTDGVRAQSLDVASVEYALDTGNVANATSNNTGRNRDNQLNAGIEN